MTRIVFSFDVEDYVNPSGADSVLRYAQILREENIRGCFNVVGKFAQKLKEWGREDVIEALKYHEIETHSLTHSHHPTINEYTDIEDYDAAEAEFLKQETECVEILKETFGRDSFPAACPPGSNTSYVAHYGYAKMGIPVYDGDTLRDLNRARPINACNIWTTDYHYLMGYQFRKNDEEAIRAHFNEVAETKDLYICYSHPNMVSFHDSWDEVNYWGGNLHEDGWVPSKPREPEQIELIFSRFRYLVRLIKADPRFRIVTYGDMAKELNAHERVLTKDQLPALKAQLEETFFPVTLPDSYSISDMFHACREMLLGAEEHKCGWVQGFLEEPFAITAPVTVTKAEMIESAKRIPAEGWLPRSVIVGSAILGTADWLRAALAVLCGEENVTVTPDVWQIDMDQFPSVRDRTYKGVWLHWDLLEDNYLTKRLQLQGWTYRFEKGTCRKVYP